MSSDNCVAILVTSDQFKIVPNPDGVDLHLNMFDLPITAYRVVHAQGIDEFDYLKEEKLYMLGKYMHDVWGKAKVFYDPGEARREAQRIVESIQYLEYGIVIIQAQKFSFT